jgi:hypothetical protein
MDCKFGRFEHIIKDIEPSRMTFSVYFVMTGTLRKLATIQTLMLGRSAAPINAIHVFGSKRSTQELWLPPCRESLKCNNISIYEPIPR